ncbi:hypothetical protein [Chryseosolibacter indicus]|uniref:SGNH hydrolase-type esterase domain-containing protein n=1 Tax=Chryseosolibacter indicus TaxID=2782351 RepID=A0ABS5VM98_9BACT|nr:hypothetical protein [Chryseosolibacter indicus]MBT1702582.1 hypothetical protein [Chryseosolibacter indicus]
MRLLKFILINIITFTVLLLIINWACGLYLKKGNTQASRDALPNYQADPDYAKQIFKDYNSVKHIYEPFVGWKCLPYHGKTLTISKEGERVHTPTDTTSRAKVVHFFGGSTMWGEGSDDQHTIPALFNQSNPQYLVYNHGQLAYNTRQEVDALITLYSKNKHADLVIFYDGVNDAAFLCPKEITQLPAHRLVPMYRDKIYVGKSAVVKELLIDIFLDNILKVIHKFTYKPTADNSLYDCVSDPAKAEEIAEIMMKNWELAHEIITQRGGKFIAILQPAAFVGAPRTDHLKLDEALGENFRSVYTNIKRKIAERKHPWIFDMTDKFDGDELIYIDFCHVSSNGNEIIAREISSVVNNINGQEAITQ